MLLMGSWVKDLNYDKEIWMHSSEMHSLVFEATVIFKDDQETLSQLEEEMEKRRKKTEEEARLRLAQMQRPETQEPLTRRFVSFRQRNPPQASISSPLESYFTPQLPSYSLQPIALEPQVADEPPHASEEDILQKQLETKCRLFDVELARKLEAQQKEFEERLAEELAR